MLVKCRECGKEISNTAKKCPSCGYQMKTGCLGTMLLLIAAFFLFLFIIPFESKKTHSNQSPKTETNTTTSPEEKQKLAAIIQKYVDAKIFIKVEKISSHPHAYIGNAFKIITIDDKRNALNLVKLYYDAEIVGVYDGYTGKHLGSFDGYNLNID